MKKTINVYLSGPMYLGKDQATSWRNEVKEIFYEWMSQPTSADILINPQDPVDRWYDDKNKLLEDGGYVVQMDKMEIEKSHVVLVNATDPGWGTPMEQYIAFTTGKMVVAFSACVYPSIWVKAHSHQLFSNHKQASYFICSIARNLIRAL